tara:strand:+ start:285 stop:527 length:243 start_codon:yes stop_codon:yes gene_type:complete
MSIKKSYMKRANILSEGFFDKLFKLLGIKDNKQKKKLSKDGEIKDAIDQMNTAARSMEKRFKKYGHRVKLRNWKPEDFIG